MFEQKEESRRKTEFSKETFHNISQFNWQNFTDRNLTRQMRALSDLGISVLPVDEVLQVSDPFCRYFSAKFTKTVFIIC